MYKPFKMKGKSPMTKKLVGKQHNLPEHLKAKIKAAPESPNKKYKSDAQRKAVHASKAEQSAMKKKSCGSAYKKYGKDSAMKMKPCPGCKTMCAGCKGKSPMKMDDNKKLKKAKKSQSRLKRAEKPKMKANITSKITKKAEDTRTKPPQPPKPGTVKGLTQFQYDMKPITSLGNRNLGFKPKFSKVKDYFTKK